MLVKKTPNIYYGLHFQVFRQKLQKNIEGSRQQNDSCKPISANHLALNSTAPAALQSLQRVSKPLVIPSQHSKTNSMSRYQRNSVEGLSSVSVQVINLPNTGDSQIKRGR